MASVTTTVVTTSPEQVVLRLLAFPTVESYVTELQDVISAHRDARDPLSLQLHQWGDRLAEVILSFDDDHSSFLDRLAAVIHELRSIAICPFDASPLETPVEANGRVWEAWKLSHIRELFDGESPFDGARLEEQRAHPFADRLISLVSRILTGEGEMAPLAERLSKLRGGEDCSRWLKESVIRGAPGTKATRVYMSLAQEALEQEEAAEEEAAMREETILLKALAERTKVATAGYVSRAAAARRELETSYEEGLAALTEMHTRNMDKLGQVLEFARKVNTDLSDRLREKAARITELESTVSSLHSRLAHAEAELSGMGSGGGGGGCVIC